jgi:alpha-1,2-mannosyltransferase
VGRLDLWLLGVGVIGMGLVLEWYAHLALTGQGIRAFPVDLNVYRDAGLIVRHVWPFYKASRKAPLYGWPGPPHHRGLRFTYPPFAALPFALMSHLRLITLGDWFTAADMLAIPTAIWITCRELGMPVERRTGLTLLSTAVALASEPVLRTISLGQVDLLLMVLVVWDVCQPDRRWLKGAGVGIAAGIKLVPLIFIPYLLLTRRYRQAAVAAATFALTIVIGFIVLPSDSSQWWLHGLFMRGSYYSDNLFAGNQSLLAILARAGTSAWHAEWQAVAVVVAILGLVTAALLDRGGHRVVGMLACALTGLLVSPISWDHHWVWIILALPVLVHYAIQARGFAREALLWSALLIVGLFAAWPTWLWGETHDPLGWTWGLIWAPPNGRGRERMWHGMQLIVGNTYVLTGIVLLIALMAVAVALQKPREYSGDLTLPGRRAPVLSPAAGQATPAAGTTTDGPSGLTPGLLPECPPGGRATALLIRGRAGAPRTRAPGRDRSTLAPVWTTTAHDTQVLSPPSEVHAQYSNSVSQPRPEAEAVAGWWNRRFDPEVDLVGADRSPVASHVYFAWVPARLSCGGYPRMW